jgi:acyl carrier protein
MALTENQKHDVLEVISDLFLVDRIKIEEQSKLHDNLGADSLDVVDLVMRLEEKFDISIPDDEYSNTITVGEIFEIIDSRIN